MEDRKRVNIYISDKDVKTLKAYCYDKFEEENVSLAIRTLVKEVRKKKKLH